VNFSYKLRCELAARACEYAKTHSLTHSLSYSDGPVVCFEPSDGLRHGNFLPGSYRTIATNPEWRRRLAKVHTRAHKDLPRRESGRWRELDSCASSDALLMNIFCYPRLAANASVALTLGIEPGWTPRFGVPARVPLVNGLCDRTEIDMRLGSVLVEAKLTEGGFQSAEQGMLQRYRDFFDVFEVERLRQREGRFQSYQLIRNILAAYAGQGSLCVLVDARRPDLIDAVYAVVSCVRLVELRTSCAVLTWQELTRVLPVKLRGFLADKYGID